MTALQDEKRDNVVAWCRRHYGASLPMIVCRAIPTPTPRPPQRRVKCRKLPFLVGPDAYVVRDALEASAAHFGLTIGDIMEVDRRRPRFRARAVAFAVLRQTTTLSFPVIARRAGGFWHPTIINASRAAAARWPDDVAAVAAALVESRR